MRASGSIGLLSSTPKRSASTDLQDLWRQTWSSMDKGGTAHSLQKNRGGRSICRHWQITKSLRKLLTNSIIHMALMPLLYILMTSIVSQENWWGHSLHFGYHIFLSICRELCMFSLAGAISINFVNSACNIHNYGEYASIHSMMTDSRPRELLWQFRH